MINFLNFTIWTLITYGVVMFWSAVIGYFILGSEWILSSQHMDFMIDMGFVVFLGMLFLAKFDK